MSLVGAFRNVLGSKRPRGEGKTAGRVISRLLDAFAEKYPGIGISPQDFWFQKGDYVKATWDLARWGADIPYRTEDGAKVRIKIYSWDTMSMCAKGLTFFVPRDASPHEFEIVSDVDPK